MATTTSAPLQVRPQSVHNLNGHLGVGAIIFMVVAAAAPLTVIGGAAPLGILLGNGVGYPSMYAVSGIILLFFSVGLSAMSRAVPKPGAFFTYVGYGFNQVIGVGAAWLALLTYTAIQLSVYAYVGYLIDYNVRTVGIPGIPWWIYSFTMIAIVGGLGYHHLELSSKVLGVFLLGEIGITVLLALAVIARGGAEGLSLAPFDPATIASGSPGVGLMFAIAGFIGFESTAIFRDEAKDPYVTIPRATFGAVILIGLLYTFAGWALVMAWGPSHVVDAAAVDAGGMMVLTAATYLGPVGMAVVEVLIVTSMFACVLSFHNVLTRYLHSMARVNLLPARLADVHARHISPYVASLTQTVSAVVLLLACVALGLDPVLEVFTWASGVATVAIVALMLLTSVAIIRYGWRHRGRFGNAWNTLVAPVVATAGLAVSATAIIVYFPTLVGGSWDLATPLLLLVPLVLAIGVVQALRLRHRRPDLYADVIDSISD